MSQTYNDIAAGDLISASRTTILARDEASATWFLGAAEPSSMAAGRPWIDTGNTLVKVRNATNTAWITIGTFTTGLGHALLAGFTMTGDILLANDPTNALHPSTKQYTDARAVTNKGKRWITGDDVITFGTSHADNNYRWVATLVSSPMGGVTTRNNKHTYPMPIYLKNEDADRGLVRINGGFGFTACGNDGAHTDEVDRFDDITNTQTVRAVATSRQEPTGYSLNGFGFTSCGFIGANTGVTQRFDDAVNTHTARLAATARISPAGYSLVGKGFTSCGNTGGVSGETQRFDDVANTHTARLAATAREESTGYGMNNYGFTSCGLDGTPTDEVERFDDDANTHTARLAATARYSLTGYSLKGKGFTACGNDGGGNTGITQRFDDAANTHTARLAAIARRLLAGYSLNGFGFTSGGWIAAITGVTQRFDDDANTHTARTAIVARRGLAGFATNAYFVNYVSYND
ncbi:hypothetical protein LCGC14_0825510 [marine sediment metagenome]|uniref:Uncharacterized protein n=1 Tax=marine sediment metagenome TaxID=412755 RepID=A0A0F9S2E5_9ZZZZ